MRGMESLDLVRREFKIGPWLPGRRSIPLIPMTLVRGLILHPKLLHLSTINYLVHFLFLMIFIISVGD